MRPDLESGYAEMARDERRENDALDWAEAASDAVVQSEGKDSKAMADQLATVSKARLFRRAGVLSQEDMRKVEEAINIQLDIR